ncbi:unnamed protein product [Caenorhabditis brenneri]
MSNPLGIFGDLPVDLLSNVCRHLPINDVITVSEMDNRLNFLVNRFIYREIKGLKVDINEEYSTITFINKDGRVTQMNLDQKGWEQVVKSGNCVEKLEMNVCMGKSTNQLFSAFRNSRFNLLSLKINTKGSLQKDHALRQRFIALLQQHRATIRHLEISTTGEQNVSINASCDASEIVFTYNQPVEPTPNSLGDHNMNHSFVHTLCQDYLKYHTVSNVTLKVASKFDANLALQKAYQVAIPFENKKYLKRLSIEFGASLKAVSEEEMKSLLLLHVSETHIATPNLQYFHCTLPNDEIDLSQEFIASLKEPIRIHRKNSPVPFNYNISLRAVRCQ